MRRKKWMSAVLSVILAMSLSVTTFAADDISNINANVNVEESTTESGITKDNSSVVGEEVEQGPAGTTEEQEAVSENESEETITEGESGTSTKESEAKAEESAASAEVEQEENDAVKPLAENAENWTAEDFTYTEITQTLNGCDYTRQFVISGRAIAGFSDSGKEKVKTNKNLVLPSKDTDGTSLVGVASTAFKNQGLTSVTFPTGMMVDYDDTVTHVVTRRGNFIIGSDSFSNNNLTNVYLPEGVIAVMSSAFRNNQITNVSLPHTIWWIENQSFAKNNLSTVGFPKSCDFQVQIHALAFAQNNIKSVRLPDYTEVVEKTAFNWNPGMEECPAEAGTKEQGMGGVVYMYTDNADLLNMERIHTIDRTATSQKSWHQKLIVGSAPVEEGAWTSADFTYDGTVITGLSESGIEKRKTNKNLALPDKTLDGQYVTELAGTTNTYGLFATESEGFEYVSFPSHLEKIGDRVFMANGLTGMESFPQTLKSIGMVAFQQNNLSSIILPDSVTELGNGAFATNPAIQTIVLSKGLTTIPDGAFGCSTKTEWMENLTEVVIPDTITKIGSRAFAGNNIKKIVIPSSVTEIGAYAFSTKNYLKDTCTVELSEGLVKIGDNAFRNKVIEEITIPSTVTGIAKNTFRKEYSDGTTGEKTKVYVNKVQYADKTNFPESDFHEYKLIIDPNESEWDAYDFTYGIAEEAKISASELKLSSVDGSYSLVLDPYFVTGFSESGKAKLEVNKNLVIPEKDPDGKQVTGIASNAFKNCGIESVKFPEGVMTDVEENLKDGVAEGVTRRGNFVILSSAFLGNNLTSVILPEGVLCVGNYAFKNNVNLEYVSIPHTMWRIANGAFVEGNIVDKKMVTGSIATVEFPENCDFKLNIDTQAFAGNKIKAVKLPKRIEKLDRYAFVWNTGMEAIQSPATVWRASEGFGVVYMYADASVKNESNVAHLENTGARQSYAQKLITDEEMPEELKPWNTNDFTYSEDGSTITGLSESGVAKRVLNPDMIIPDQAPSGVDVIALADSTNASGGLFATDKEKLNSVILPAKLESIGNNAFADSGIGNIEFPETLQKIGNTSFRANNMTQINLPDSVTSVGSGAFTMNLKLEKIKISAGMTEIPASFAGCSGNAGAENFTELTIPEGIVTIGDRAFAGNNLTDLIVPNSVKKIGNYAFAQVPTMKSLKNITLFEGLESIGKYAFRYANVKEIILPTTVTVLEKTAFNGVDDVVILYTSNKEQLENHDKFVAVGDKHKTVYSNLIGTGWTYADFEFDGATIKGWSEQGHQTRLNNKNLVIPEINPTTGEAITKIADEAFKIPDNEVDQLKDSVVSPNGMQTVSIPATVTEIGKKAFEYNSLVDVTIADNITSIGESAFHGNQLTKLVLPDSVTELGGGAFAENNITDLTLSRNVTVIPQGAFSMNIRLEHVDIPETVTEIGDTAFAGARLTSLEIPKSVTKIGKKAFHLHHLEEITVPGNVKEIGESAFEGTPKAIRMKKITLEEGIESIGKNAFKEGYIESVQLPESLKSLDKTAFSNNAGTNNDHVVVLYTSNPEHLNFEESSVQKIVFSAEWGTDCFVFDENGVLVGLSTKGQALVKENTEVVIPDQTEDGKEVTEIGEEALKGYGITKVTLPKGLKKIGKNAFAENKLTSVSLPESMEEIQKDAFESNEEIVKILVPNQAVYDKLKNGAYEGAELVYEEEIPEPTPEPKPEPTPNPDQGNGTGNAANGSGNTTSGSSTKTNAGTKTTTKTSSGTKTVPTGDESPVLPVGVATAISLMVIASALRKKRAAR